MKNETVRNQSIYHRKIYDGNYWPKITYYYAKTWTEFQMSWHHHESIEVMYVFMGDCTVFVQSLSGEVQELALQAGDFILIDSCITHQLHVKPHSFCYMLNIELLFVQTQDRMFTMKNILETCDVFAQMVQQKRVYVLGHDINGELFRAIYVLQNTYLRTEENLAHRSILDAEMAVFLVQLGQILSLRRNVTGLSVHVKRAVQYIENKFSDPITVPEVARFLGIHTAHLQRIFHTAMGVTVVQYLTRVRVEKAKILLESMPELTIEKIAFMVGYKSRQHFALCFKKLTLVTPNKYKNFQHRI